MNGEGNHTGELAKQDVLDTLLRSHEAYFDVFKDYAYAGREFPGYAEFHSHSEQFVLVKRAKLWEVDAFEYIFFDMVDHLDDSWADEAYRYMTTEAVGKVVPEPNHMMSFVSMVAIADSVAEETRKKIRKMHFRKHFMLGFRGWVDLRMAVIDLSSMEVITNGMGKEMKSTLLSCLQAAQRSSLEVQGQLEPVSAGSNPAVTSQTKEEVELS